MADDKRALIAEALRRGLITREEAREKLSASESAPSPEQPIPTPEPVVQQDPSQNFQVRAHNALAGVLGLPVDALTAAINTASELVSGEELIDRPQVDRCIQRVRALRLLISVSVGPCEHLLTVLRDQDRARELILRDQLIDKVTDGRRDLTLSDLWDIRAAATRSDREAVHPEARGRYKR